MITSLTQGPLAFIRWPHQIFPGWSHALKNLSPLQYNFLIPTKLIFAKAMLQTHKKVFVPELKILSSLT